MPIHPAMQTIANTEALLDSVSVGWSFGAEIVFENQQIIRYEIEVESMAGNKATHIIVTSIYLDTEDLVAEYLTPTIADARAQRGARL